LNENDNFNPSGNKSSVPHFRYDAHGNQEGYDNSMKQMMFNQNMNNYGNISNR
jgi:hypothetical protein